MRLAVLCLMLSACASPAASSIAVADAALTAADAAADSAPSEYVATLADFDCVKNGTKVGHFYVANRLGAEAAAVAVAQGSQAGAQYPIGTVIRLFPLEVMVKRGGSAYAATGGWEMFRLKYDDAGKLQIAERGGAEVKNGAGSCASCHDAAKSFDFVCGQNHGCAPIAVSAEAAAMLQDADPECP